MTNRDALPAPPGFRELASAGLIAATDNGDQWFSLQEAHTAEWLRHRGLAVHSVRRREGHRLRTPDAAAIEYGATIELKRASATVNAITQRIRTARWQSQRVVVDLRETGASQDLAEHAMRRALQLYGAQLHEVLLILDGLGVGWSYG